MRSRIILLISIFVLLFTFGCKPKVEDTTEALAKAGQAIDGEEVAAEEDVAPEGAADAAKAVAGKSGAVELSADYNLLDAMHKGSVAVENALLAYVPKDSPIVFATTKSYALNDPFITKSMALYDDYMADDVIMEELESLSDEFDLDELGINVAAGVEHLLKEVIKLTKDYTPEAFEAIGLDIQKPSAQVIYFIGGQFVAKQNGIKDAEVFKKWAVGNVDKFGIASTQETIDGVEWVLYTVAGQITVGLQFSEILTVTACLTKDKATALPAALKVADTPITIDGLKTIAGPGQVIAVGHVELAKLLQWINGEDTPLMRLLDSFDPELKELAILDKECTDELASVVRIVPSLTSRVFVSPSDNGVYTTGVQFQVNIKDALTAKFAKLMTPVANLGVKEENTLANLNINFDLGLALEVLQSVGKRVSDKPYQCEFLSDLNDLSELKSAVAEPEDIKKIQGIRVALTGFEVEDSVPKNIQGQIGILGDGLLAALKNVAGDQLGMIEGITFEEGVKSTYNLSKDLQIDQSIDIIFTASGIYLSTPEHDVTGISVAGTHDTIDLIGVMIDTKSFEIYHEGSGSDLLAKELEILKKFKKLYYGANVDESGLSLRVALTF